MKASSKSLTRRDKDLLKAIALWEVSNIRQCPTYRDLAAAGIPFGTVQDRVQALRQRGLITHRPGVPRSIELTAAGRTYFQEAQ